MIYFKFIVNYLTENVNSKNVNMLEKKTSISMISIRSK